MIILLNFQSEHSYDWVHEEMDPVGGQAVGPGSYNRPMADWGSAGRVTEFRASAIPLWHSQTWEGRSLDTLLDFHQGLCLV